MLPRVLAPFSSQNYRRFFLGQSVSLVGSWMTQTATIWLVYELTGSPFWLGVVALTSQLPMILLGPFAGVWVDRLPRLKLLLTTQALSMGQSLLLAYVALTGRMDIWLLAGFAFAQGVINAFDLPTRQSLAVLLVEKREHLAGVIGMNASLFHLARLIGPALAGWIIAIWGAGYCFLIDGLSYLAALAALGSMQLAAVPPATRAGSVWVEMKLGFQYVFSSLPLTVHILFPAAMGFFALSYGVLIPVYVTEVFQGDARTLGGFMASTAAGAVLAALYLAGRKQLPGIGRVILSGTLLTGIGLLVFAFSHTLWLSMGCLMLVGLGSVLVMAANNTLVQNLVEEDKRGRTLSLLSMGILGGMPLGGLVIGSLAGSIGITATTSLNAAACLILAVLFARVLPILRREARPILERSGALAPLK